MVDIEGVFPVNQSKIHEKLELTGHFPVNANGGS